MCSVLLTGLEPIALTFRSFPWISTLEGLVMRRPLLPSFSIVIIVVTFILVTSLFFVPTFSFQSRASDSKAS
jgi:hypothetical protein